MKRMICIAALCMAFGLCACGGQTDSSSSSQENPATPTVSFEQNALELTEGETYALTYVLDGAEATALVWSSTDENVVTVSVSEGNVSLAAQGAGEASVVVSIGETEISSVEVVVKESPLSVSVPAGRLVLRKNRTVTVKARAEEGLSLDNVEWSSSDTSIATVEYQGLTARVTSVSRGECEITVRVGEVSCSFTLVVGIA